MAHLRLDARSSTAHINGRIVRLTPLEYSLLEHLLEAFPADVPYGELLMSVWGEQAMGHKNYLKLYVAYLRGKLGRGPGDPLIVNRRGTIYGEGGYRLELR